MTFNEKLQRLRKASGLSQEQLAEKLNVSRQAISKWELGAIPDIDNILKISRFFDCSLDDLMNNEAPAAPVSASAGAAQTAGQPEAHGQTAGRPSAAPWIAGSVTAGLGAIGLLVLGILSSVFPAILYDPPQGDVRRIEATGFVAFLQLHRLTWLFVLCCVLVLLGLTVLIATLALRRALPGTRQGN